MTTLNTALLKVAGLAIIALALTVFLACGNSSEAGDGDSAINDGGDAAVEHDDDGHEADDEHEADEILINLRTEDFVFLPKTITVKVGQTIRLHLENSDPVLHDYTADEAEFIILEASGAVHTDHEDASHEDADEHDSDAQVSLQPLHIAAEANGHGDLVFQATEAGQYEFYCSVP
ncbi:MAG: hypothetical protein V3U45_04525, partial [bacterium]